MGEIVPGVFGAFDGYGVNVKCRDQAYQPPPPGELQARAGRWPAPSLSSGFRNFGANGMAPESGGTDARQLRGRSILKNLARRCSDKPHPTR